MEPLKIHDYLIKTRRRVLDWMRPLSAEQYGRELRPGSRSIQRTMTHTLSSEWYYVQRIERRDVPPYEEWSIREEEAPAFAALEAAWSKQDVETRVALNAVRDWNTPFEYRVIDDEGKQKIVTASAGDLFTQLVLHEVHHRAQAMSMLRELGVALDDIDFNTTMYPRRDASPNG